ncbi:LAETG motif-containing sortase-dependent surface protein, partial [Streptomyces chrestomyceticus]|uniref:LAETG motif-containing sortase-dependent surface protein n=1 Tax=Streptomyces chrestomyceticus TaxID=68185 RepID=UPI0033F4511C
MCGQRLAETGSSDALPTVALIGGAAVVVGGAAVLITRRRRTDRRVTGGRQRPPVRWRARVVEHTASVALLTPE